MWFLAYSDDIHLATSAIIQTDLSSVNIWLWWTLGNFNGCPYQQLLVRLCVCKCVCCTVHEQVCISLQDSIQKRQYSYYRFRRTYSNTKRPVSKVVVSVHIVQRMDSTHTSDLSLTSRQKSRDCFTKHWVVSWCRCTAVVKMWRQNF